VSEQHLLGIFCKCALCGEEQAMHFPCEMCDHAHPLCPKCLRRFKARALVSKPMALNRLALLACATEEALVGGRLMQ
jgi:hypothetical protein